MLADDDVLLCEEHTNDPEKTFVVLDEQAVKAWLASLDLGPETVKNYTIKARHATGTPGSRRLRDLTPPQMHAFLEILRDAIQLAMIHGLAGRTVAAIVTATPRGREGRPSRSLSPEQAQAVPEAARGKRLR